MVEDGRGVEDEQCGRVVGEVLSCYQVPQPIHLGGCIGNQRLIDEQQNEYVEGGRSEPYCRK
mgnify:CR=1 FL=1